MMPEYDLRRYAAYFRGWCQAFGEHENLSGSDTDINWLLGDRQVGFILPNQLTRSLFREVLRRRETPEFVINRKGFRIGSFSCAFTGKADLSALDAIRNVLETGQQGHVYLTSHFMYGSGAKIITLSGKKPLSIIYKEIGRMHINLR
jgi:hypothetical protein